MTGRPPPVLTQRFCRLHEQNNLFPVYETFIVAPGLFNATFRDFQMGQEHPAYPGCFADKFVVTTQGEHVKVMIRYTKR